MNLPERYFGRLPDDEFQKLKSRFEFWKALAICVPVGVLLWALVAGIFIIAGAAR